MATMLGNSMFGSRDPGMGEKPKGKRPLRERIGDLRTSDYGYITEAPGSSKGPLSENYAPMWVDATSVSDLIEDPYLKEIFKGMSDRDKARYATTHEAELREFRKGFKQRKRSAYSAAARTGAKGGSPGGRTLLTRNVGGVPDSELTLGRTMLGGGSRPLGY